ncbi:MAG TPA: BON domain-containing protein [Terriglobales bacterium]|nr:BON domain-containing protein [Terriglobales bacterium]
MKSHSLLLTLGLALATTYGLAQTGQTGSQAGQYPSSQSPTTQQQPSTQQVPPSNSPDQGQATAPDQNQTSNTAPDNDALAQQVQQKLSTEPALKDVQVEAKKGVVTLSGSVASKADRKHAEELAKSVPGVKKVHAKLKVNPNAAATTSGAAETPAPSAAGSEAGNTEAQAGVKQGNQEPGSMTSSTQAQNQGGAENRSAEQGQMNSQAQQQSPSTAQTEPGQAQPGMTQQGVQTPNAGSNNQMGTNANATQIQSEIQNAISQQGTLSGSNIQVNVTDTDVELTGNVATPDQKQTAERIAGSYAANRRVVNHITVSSLNGQTGAENPNTPSATQPQTTPGQGSVNPQTPPRQTPPSQQQQPPMSETPPQPQL